MYKKGQTNPEKLQDQNTTLMLFYVDTRIFLKAMTTDIVPSPKVVHSLSKPSCLLWEALVCEKHIPKTAPNGKKNYHGMLMPLHDSMPSFMNFRRVLDLLEFKNQVSQHFAGNQQCPGVWNSFPSLAWDLEIHPRTHMWFFNQLWCTGACACSSNSNYEHKMPRKPSWCIKKAKRTPKNSKIKHNTPVVLCWH